MLQQEKLNNIHKLKNEEVLQILHECVEALGLVDMETATMALGVSKRRIYQLMNDNNSLVAGKHKLPLINLIKLLNTQKDQTFSSRE